MASMTIRNLDDGVKTELRKRAAGNGRSMEEEVRLILRDAVGQEAVPNKDLGTRDGDSRTVQALGRCQSGLASARADARAAAVRLRQLCSCLTRTWCRN